MAVTSNLLVEQGATFTATIQYSDDNGNPSDLSNYTVQSQMRRSYYSANSTSISASISDAANGEITLNLTATNTSNIKPGRYVYDVNIARSNVITRVVEGIITVLPGVTR